MPDKHDDTQDLSGTQPVSLPEWKPTPPTPPTPTPPTPPTQPPISSSPAPTPPTPSMPLAPRTATPASGHVQQASQRYERRKRKRDDRNRSAFYFPAWSVGLMLLLVFGITGAIVMLVITLGGQSAPGGQPRIVIITAQPTDTQNASEAATATNPGVEALPSLQGPLPTFALEGPTLAPVVLSPTPVQIVIGETVIVNSDSLNIRMDAGITQKLLTTAVKGDRFRVIDGPKQADNITWWKLQDTTDLTNEVGLLPTISMSLFHSAPSRDCSLFHDGTFFSDGVI